MTNIAFKQAHSGNYRRAARGKEDIRYLVIHFTANDGDTAKNNADYFARAEISTSAHYFVDENEVWQSVRDADIAWHCGTRGVYFHPYCRNANSIGIELCSRKNGEKFYFMPETVRRAQALTRELMVFRSKMLCAITMLRTKTVLRRSSRAHPRGQHSSRGYRKRRNLT